MYISEKSESFMRRQKLRTLPKEQSPLLAGVEHISAKDWAHFDLTEEQCCISVYQPV